MLCAETTDRMLMHYVFITSCSVSLNKHLFCTFNKTRQQHVSISGVLQLSYASSVFHIFCCQLKDMHRLQSYLNPDQDRNVRTKTTSCFHFPVLRLLPCVFKKLILILTWNKCCQNIPLWQVNVRMSSLCMPWRCTGSVRIPPLIVIVNLSTGWRWVVNCTPPVPTEEEAGCAPQLVRTFWTTG